MSEFKPPARHLIIVPSESSGAELIKSLGAAQGNVIGIETATILGLAKKILSAEMFTQRIRFIRRSEGIFLMYKALGNVRHRFDYFQKMSLSMDNASAFYNTYDTFVKSTSPSTENVKESLFDGIGNLQKSHDLQLLFQEYETLKNQPMVSHETSQYFTGPCWDECDLLKQAFDVMAANKEERHRYHQVFIPRHLELYPLEAAFLSKFLPNYQLLSLSEIGREMGYDNTTDVYQLKHINVLSGYGEINEVKGIIRHILYHTEVPGEENNRLENVVIGVTDYPAYAHILMQVCQRYQLPVTFGKGFSAAITKPGRLVSLLLQWLNTQSAVDFRNLVMSDCFNTNKMIKHYIKTAKDQVRQQLEEANQDASFWTEALDEMVGTLAALKMNGHQLTKVAIDLRLNTGSEDDKDKLKQYCQRMGQILFDKAEKRHTAKSFEHDVESEEAEDDKKAWKVKECLANMVYAETLSQFYQEIPAQPSLQIKWLYQEFGHIYRQTVDKTPGKKPFWVEQWAGMDAAANQAIVRVLEDLEPSDNLLTVAGCLEYTLKNTNVGGSTSEPGHIHVVPWEEICWTMRDHVYLTGVDQERFPGKDQEDPLLLDDEKEAMLKILHGVETIKEEHIFFNGNVSLKKRRNMEQIIDDVAMFSKNLTITHSNYHFMEHRERIVDTRMLDYAASIAPLTHTEQGFINEDEHILDVTGYWLKAKQQNLEMSSNLTWADTQINQAATGLQYREEITATEYDGVIGKIGTKELLSRPWSPSRLEKIGQCPFKFFVASVLGIGEPEALNVDPTQWLDNKEKGTIIHQVAERFMDKAMQGETVLESDLLQTLLQVMEEKAIVKAPPSKMVFDAERSSLQEKCKALISVEAYYRQELIPEGVEEVPANRLIEYSFESVKVPVEPEGSGTSPMITLHGRLDRLDTLTNGQQIIIDYKSGKPDYTVPNAFDQGRQVQLYLYSLMCEQEWGHYPVEAYYFFLGGEKSKEMPVSCGLNPEQKVKTLQWLKCFHNLWLNGEFVLTDNFRKDCVFCEYETICNKELYSDEAISAKHQTTTAPREVRSIE